MSGQKVPNPDFPVFLDCYHNALKVGIIISGCYHKIFPKKGLEGFLCYPNIGNNGLQKTPEKPRKIFMRSLRI